ncbi:MAG: cobalamin-dependent protein, partial [Candidatus Omnitrophota bacterium]
MTEKILLTCPPVSFDAEKKALRFPLGILCLGSYLKQRGIHVKVYHDQPYTQKGFLKTLQDYRPAAVGFSCDSANFQTCVALSKLVKKFNKDIFVIAGGIHASCFDRLILEKTPTIDIVVRHEGEESLAEILEHISARKSLEKIEGTSCRANNRITVNKDRPFIKDIDTMPPLAYELIDMDKVESYNFPGWWPIHSGRGCCFNCKFCASVGQWKRAHRAMGPQRVIEEVDHCRERHHIRGCYFYELTFTIDKDRVRRICHAMKKRNIPWGCYTNPS